MEFRVVGLTGSERWVDARSVPFETTDASGPQRCVLSVASDITERRQLEAQLRGAQQMEAVGRLAGGIAHDFNNLLTGMGGFTELVWMSLPEDDPRRDDLSEVQKGCQRAAALTRQLLALSRRQSLEPRVLDVNALIAGIEKLLRRTIREDIDIVMTLNPVEPVRVDPVQFEQVLLNLALNARDAMPAGGQLRFVTESVVVDETLARRYRPMRMGRYARITVTDSGTGMDAETQAHVFEPFFTTKPAGKGTGLGLATVYGTVKQSGGFIWLDSREGHGTSVAIYLPTVDAIVEQPHGGSGDRGAVTGGSEIILLVEDDGAVRRLTSHTLRHHGYTVLDARDGEHALDVSERHRGVINLLVTDVVMPGLTGPALAHRLVSQRPDMRVLYTSGYADGVTAHAGAPRDRVPLLSKPFLPADLLRRVRGILDGREAD
jgi:signal transduction histidine kinase/CheY-like chemotaxis protein